MSSGNPIGLKDLFDFDNPDVITKVYTELKKLSDQYETFKEIVTDGWFEKIANQQSEVAQATRDLVAANKELLASNKDQQKLIVSNFETMQKLEAKTKELAETKKSVAQLDEVAADSVKGLKNRLKELMDEYNSLSQSEVGFGQRQRELSKEINTTRKEIYDLNSAIKVNVKTFQAAKGSYDALDRETKELVADLRKLEGGMNATSEKAKKLKKQIYENTQRLKQFDAEMNHNFRNVGNYKSAFGGLTGQLKAYALGLVSIAALTRGVSAAFDQSLKFDAISRSLAFVSDSTIEAEKNMLFLRRIANELGLEFETLARSYTRFTAATRGTNLEGEATRKIFTSVSKAVAVMKLSAAEAEGVFLALEQIVSKGKLQSEELRKQLGNRLPGAYALFAKGLGITTAQMDKFLKKGQITKDSLVAFADQLEKSFGAGVAANVDSVQSAVNRLSNTMKELAQGKSLSDFFRDVISGTNTLIRKVLQLDNRSRQLAITQKAEAEEAERLVAEYTQLNDKVDKTKIEKARLTSIVTTLASKFGDSVVEIDKETGALRLNIEATKDLITQKLLLSNDEAAKSAARYKKALDDQVNAMQRASASATILNAAEKETGLIYEELRDLALTPSKTGSLLDTKLLSANQQKVLQLGIAFEQQQTQLNNARADVAKYTKELEDLGFTAEDVNKLLNPEFDATTFSPIGEKTPEELERERQKQIRSAKAFIKATEQLRLSQLRSEYVGEESSLENKILFEDSKLRIIKDSVTQQQALYKEGSTEYVKLEKILVDATRKREEEIAKATEDGSKNFIKNAEKRFKKAQDQAKQYYGYLAAEELKKADAKINALLLGKAKNPSADGDAEADLQIFEIRKGILEKEVAAIRLAVQEKKNTDEDYWKTKQDLANAEKELEREKADFAISQAQRVAESKQAVEQAFFDFASSSFNSLFQIQANNIEAERLAIEKRYNHEIDLAGNNLAAKTEADRKYKQELNANLRKQSENQKSAAVFKITIDTAAAAARALADYQYPYSLIVAGLAAASGIAQLSAVNSEPIPEYAKGRKGGKKELARLNEQGTELIERKGRFYVAGGGKDTITQLEAGDTVHTHKESMSKIAAMKQDAAEVDNWLESIFTGIDWGFKASGVEADKIVAAITNNSLDSMVLEKSFARAIAKMPSDQILFDENGYKRYQTRRSERSSYVNGRNRNSLKGLG